MFTFPSAMAFMVAKIVFSHATWFATEGFATVTARDNLLGATPELEMLSVAEIMFANPARPSLQRFTTVVATYCHLGHHSAFLK